LQSAFHEWSGVPERVRSDSLSTAVNNLSNTRELRERQHALLVHYDLEGERINPRCGHENGDAVASHGHFQTALDQQLGPRGSRDFASREEDDAFLRRVRERRNLARQKLGDFANYCYREELFPTPLFRLAFMEVFDGRNYAEEDSSRAADAHRSVVSAASQSVEPVERVDAAAASATEDAPPSNVRRTLPEVGRDRPTGNIEARGTLRS
jgi:hypothetical protein